jgi:hypothetical protein
MIQEWLSQVEFRASERSWYSFFSQLPINISLLQSETAIALDMAEVK